MTDRDWIAIAAELAASAETDGVEASLPKPPAEAPSVPNGRSPVLLEELGLPMDLPAREFRAFDVDVPTEHQCPKCGYRWSGKSAAVKETTTV